MYCLFKILKEETENVDVDVSLLSFQDFIRNDLNNVRLQSLTNEFIRSERGIHSFLDAVSYLFIICYVFQRNYGCTGTFRFMETYPS